MLAANLPRDPVVPSSQLSPSAGQVSAHGSLAQQFPIRFHGRVHYRVVYNSATQPIGKSYTGDEPLEGSFDEGLVAIRGASKGTQSCSHPDLWI